MHRYITISVCCILFISLAQAAQGRTVNVGVYSNEPLIFYGKDGSIKGVYHDVLQVIAAKEKWEVNYVIGSWEECLDRLNNGDVDLLTAIAVTEERRAWYDFNNETVVTNWAQVYSRNDGAVRSYIDINKLKMAVLKNDIYYDALKEVGEKFKIFPEYVEVGSYDEILRFVKNGNADLALVPRIFGAYHEHQYNLYKTPINFGPVELRFATLKGKNRDIIEGLDRQMEKMRYEPNSILNRSIDLWIEGVRKLVFPSWLKPKWVVITVFSAILFLSIGVYVLRWQVRVRTEALQRTIAAKEKIESELRIAHEIQMSLVPQVFPPFPDRHEFDIFGMIKPAREVGGDLYDFFFIDHNRLLFVIGDVSDKGVPAALLMARTKTLIKSAAAGGPRPDEILCLANREFCDNNDAMMFVTIFLGVIDLEEGLIVFTNAGHNPPLICRGGGRVEFLKSRPAAPLGIDEDTNYVTSEIKLEKGEQLFMYTDGVTEAFNLEGDIYSDERLHDLLSQSKQPSPQIQVKEVFDDLKLFADGAEQTDDITILAIKYQGAAGH